MLVSIGRRAAPENLVALLLECHTRIRHFAALAERVGTQSGVAPDDAREACERCTRYFTEAFPLHLQDEEQSLLPRLRSTQPEVDAALDTMLAQHADHEPALKALLAALQSVREAPESTPHRAALGLAAAALRAQLEPHLALEEAVLFPAAHKLTPEAEAAIITELRARRR